MEKIFDHVPRVVPALFMLLLCLFWANETLAAYSFGLELRGVYEDNIFGSSQDIEKQGDFYTVLSVSAEAEKGTGPKTSLFARGDAGQYIYARYDDLNLSTAGIVAGLKREFGTILSGEVYIGGRLRKYNDDARDSAAVSAGLALRQQVSFRSWLREYYEFEKNNADSDFFSYDGHLVGINAGYLINPKTLAMAGYSYLSRSYDEPSGYDTDYHTLSIGFVRELTKSLFLNAAYFHQFISSPAESDDANNAYTLGLIYRF